MAIDIHQQQSSFRVKKIDELESLRGLAALLIVFFHIPKWHSLLDVGIINNGNLMIELFFVLSGFVIYNAYCENINSGIDLVRFQFLRFGRLYPVHFLFLLIYLLIEVAKYIAEIKFGISTPNSRPFKENNWTALVEQLLLVHAVGPTGNALTFNVPAWSISTEFFTYLVFGVILLWLRQVQTWIFAVIVVSALVMLGTGETFGCRLLLKCLAGFFLGCLTAQLLKKTTWTVPGYWSALVILVLIGFLQLKKELEYDSMVYFLTALMIISLVRTEGGWCRKILRFQPLLWLGSISYSLYMAHFLVIWGANQVLRVVLKKPEIFINGKSYPQLSAAETVFTVMVIVFLVLLIAQIIHHMLEIPLREKSRRVVFEGRH